MQVSIGSFGAAHRQRRNWLLLLTATACLGAIAAEYHASPMGVDTAAGTPASPMSLAKALSRTSPARPGDTIWLHSGVYVGPFTSFLAGTSNDPIVVRQFPNERATLDGRLGGEPVLTLAGSGTWFWGFEVMNSDTNRNVTREQAISANPGVAGSDNKLINLILHDTGQGMFLSWQSTNMEVTGCLIYNNGFQLADRGHGHGVYTQNRTGRKLVRDNIIFNQFGWGVHAYTQSGFVNNMDFVGNVVFNNGSLSTPPASRTGILVMPAANPSTGNTVSENMLYHGLSKYGYGVEITGGVSIPGFCTNSDITITGNVFGNCTLLVSSVTNATILNNWIGSSPYRYLDWRIMGFEQRYNWDGNQYFNSLGFTVYPGGTGLRWEQWRTAYPDYDVNGALHNDPTNAWVYLRTNPYEQGRANVVVYNWGLSNKVQVDVTKVLPAGASYEVRNAQDFYAAPVAKGVFEGAPIVLPMTNLTVAVPVGWQTAPPATGPKFNVFVLLRTVAPPSHVRTISTRVSP